MINLPKNSDLDGMTAVVTGGSGVLCSEMARVLAACGVKVAVLGRTLSKIESVGSEVQANGGYAIGVQIDVLSKESIEAAHKEVMDDFGHVDILINGAGGNHQDGTAQKETVTSEDIASSLEGSFFDFKSAGVSHVFDLNFLSTVEVCQVFGESMAKAGCGSIINISSMSAYHPLTKVMSYSASKAAINSFTEWLAVHLAPTGVRVNAIAPGFFLTEQNRTLLTNANGSYTARAEKIIASTPMDRFGDASELSGALLWLANPKSSGFVTGAIIPVDGGFNAFSGV